ncbi:MAG: hypothetical protein BA874_07310 [Desulfuromonadales bacterium C00003068]|jgi:hypothetical protein|nr:hypothetical protein [Deltaproteobacteria bacterium]OEU74252.1 MAG: hypothetical protein BA874_07310 [Desulfuromonadales bacterium C00003068]
MKKRHDNSSFNPHKSTSVLCQPYTKNRFKHLAEHIVAIVLILITVTSLSFAAANFFGKNKSSALAQEANSLVPAIYFKNEENDSVTL